jgi:hypothetical protein
LPVDPGADHGEAVAPEGPYYVENQS